MRILVTDGMDKTAMAQLREAGHEVVEQFYAPEELGAALREFDAVVVRSKTKVRANHIDEAKGGKLRLIIRGGVGVDNIDVKYAEANGITVKNTPKASSQSVAELAMGHMFSCARYISVAGHTMREGKWEKKAYGKGIELQGKTLGIVGFGRIGQKLGKMAKAIGMNVIAFDIFHIPGIEEELGIPYVEMDELLAKSDFISVHAPAVDGGALINAERIAKMKDGVCIINTSRGTNVDEAALLDALNSGKVRAAGLDVYADEPATNVALSLTPWSPARRTSARRPSRRRAASAKSWSRSSPRCNFPQPAAKQKEPPFRRLFLLARRAARHIFSFPLIGYSNKTVLRCTIWKETRTMWSCGASPRASRSFHTRTMRGGSTNFRSGWSGCPGRATCR